MPAGEIERLSGGGQLDPGTKEATDQNKFQDHKVPESEPNGSYRPATGRTQRKTVSLTADMTKPGVGAPGIVCMDWCTFHPRRRCSCDLLSSEKLIPH